MRDGRGDADAREGAELSAEEVPAAGGMGWV
jgi:hypothetical protein